MEINGYSLIIVGNHLAFGLFPMYMQAYGQAIVKQVVPDSPVRVPVHAYPSPQIHIQPSAPGESLFLLRFITYSIFLPFYTARRS